MNENEHDDDIEPEVEADVEFETEEFPILDDEDADESEDADELGIDPDESELSAQTDRASYGNRMRIAFTASLMTARSLLIGSSLASNFVRRF